MYQNQFPKHLEGGGGYHFRKALDAEKEDGILTKVHRRLTPVSGCSKETPGTLILDKAELCSPPPPSLTCKGLKGGGAV